MGHPSCRNPYSSPPKWPRTDPDGPTLPHPATSSLHTHPGDNVSGWVGWLVVTYCGHPQPFRRPRALRWRRLVAVRGGSAGVLWVTLVTTTGTRGVGRGPVTYTRAIMMHSGLVVMHEFQKKSKKPKKLPFYRVGIIFLYIPTRS